MGCKGTTTLITLPKLEIYYDQEFYEIVDGRCSIPIPENDSFMKAGHIFGLYLNGIDTGLTAAVTIIANEGDIEAVAFGLAQDSKDYMFKPGGEVRLTITTRHTKGDGLSER